VTSDAVILATGATPRRLPGTDGLSHHDGLFTLRTLDDSLALRARLTEVESCRVIVIGAGFIGAEVASTCAGLGCQVTVIEAMEIPLSNVLGPLIGTHCGSLHAAHGVDLRTGVGVAGVRRVENSAAVSPSNSSVERSWRPRWSWSASAWLPRLAGSKGLG